MIKVPDAASFATIHFLEQILDRKCGGSTGTNVFAALELVGELSAAGETGSVVTMLCDGGERYLDSYYDDEWLRERGFDLEPHRARLDSFYANGRF